MDARSQNKPLIYSFEVILIIHISLVDGCKKHVSFSGLQFLIADYKLRQLFVRNVYPKTWPVTSIIGVIGFIEIFGV